MQVNPLVFIVKASQFVGNPVELEAQIIRRTRRRKRSFRDRNSLLAFLDYHLYESYRYLVDGIVNLCWLLEPQVKNLTPQSPALTVPQTVSIALRFFASGKFNAVALFPS